MTHLINDFHVDSPPRPAVQRHEPGITGDTRSLLRDIHRVVHHNSGDNLSDLESVRKVTEQLASVVTQEAALHCSEQSRRV